MNVQVFDVRDDFPDDFYEEFARLAVAFGRIEYMIKLSIKSLGGKGFTAGMAHAESKRQFSVLCEEAKKEANARLYPSQATSFYAIIDQAKDLGDYRNDTIHALWTTDDKTGQPLRIRPKWDKASKSVDWSRGGPVTVGELRATREEMERVFQALDTERQAWPSRP